MQSKSMEWFVEDGDWEVKDVKYPVMKYVRSDQKHVLDLHSYDGTYRKVTFSSKEGVEAAWGEGRARLDCTAVFNGLLPRDAVSVSRAIALDADAVLKELNPDIADGPTDPMATIRLQFSQKLMVDRSECITTASDATVRHEHPERAALYDALLDDLARSSSE